MAYIVHSDRHGGKAFQTLGKEWSGAVPAEAVLE